MAEALTIARPYAEAAFSLALEQQALPSWADALERIAAVASNPIARELVGNPALTAQQVADVIVDSAGGLTDDQRRFVRTAAENERLGVMPEVSTLFQKLRHAHEGSLDAVIQSAFPLTDAQTADIVATLEQKYGRKVNARVEVEPELIGGVAIHVGDEVMDASVRGKLAQLAASLKV